MTHSSLNCSTTHKEGPLKDTTLGFA